MGLSYYAIVNSAVSLGSFVEVGHCSCFNIPNSDNHGWTQINSI